jgi:hypothetical protein
MKEQNNKKKKKNQFFVKEKLGLDFNQISDKSIPNHSQVMGIASRECGSCFSGLALRGIQSSTALTV